jgi:hypothetical protein
MELVWETGCGLRECVVRLRNQPPQPNQAQGMHVRHPNMHGKDVHVCGRGADGRITETTRDAQHTLVVEPARKCALLNCCVFNRGEREREGDDVSQTTATC